MYTVNLIKLLPSTIYIILTWAPFSKGEIEELLIENIKNVLKTEKKTADYLVNMYSTK